MIAWIKGTEVNRDIARQFITNRSARNTAAAANVVDPAQIDADELNALATTISGGGTIQDISPFGGKTSADSEKGSEVQFVSAVTYAGGKQRKLAIRQIKVGDQWKIVEVEQVP